MSGYCYTEIVEGCFSANKEGLFMEYITENLRTPVGEHYDVIVAGSGPAGCCAAIAAARAGASVLLVEQQGCFGGMWTTGLVNPVFDWRNKTGLMKEIVEKLAARGGFGGFIRSCYQIEDMKSLLDELLTEAGVHLLSDTVAAAVLQEGNTITGLIVENKSGRTAYPAAVVIDCTGDADVCARAGVETVMGGEDETDVQACTLMFAIGNVNFEQDHYYQLANMVKEAIERTGSSYRLPYARPYIIQAPGCDQAVVQLTHMHGVDPRVAEDTTAAKIEGRRQARDAFLFLKENVPMFKDITLLQPAAQLGIRESRRLVGEYTITTKDMLEGHHTEDAIATATFNVDIHNQNNDEQSHFDVKPYGIPYRSMVPVKADGLLVAGRCISGTHEAMASYRVTADCAAMGQAAGCAAALCAQKCCTPRALPFAELRVALQAQGVVLPGEK